MSWLKENEAAKKMRCAKGIEQKYKIGINTVQKKCPKIKGGMKIALNIFLPAIFFCLSRAWQRKILFFLLLFYLILIF